MGRLADDSLRAALALGALAWAPAALAAPLSAPQYTPGMSGERDYLQVQGARLLAPGRVAGGVHVHHDDRPLSSTSLDGRAVVRVEDRLHMDFTFALGLWERLQVGVGAPLTLSHRRLDDEGFVADGLRAPAMGDLRVGSKLSVFHTPGGLDVALAAGILLPTGDGEFLRGEDGTVYAPELLVRQAAGSRLSFALNAGLLFRDQRSLPGSGGADEVVWGAAAAYDLSAWRWSAIAEATGRSLSASVDEGGRGEPPSMVRVAVRWRPREDWALTVGGAAFVTEDEGVTTPRGLVSLTYTAESLPDRDGDGVADPFDACPAAGEDADGVEDWDGCPDLDDDGDSVPDGQDRCPDRPEDPDGFEDEDGCPDPDNDADGKADEDDACPNDPEDADGFDDFDGCPDLDDDQDGVLDEDDQCGTLQEDPDGFQDQDGCPDLDNDGDGVPDVADQCPLVREDADGFHDSDGCPDEDNDGDGVRDSADRCPLVPEDINGVGDDDGCPEGEAPAAPVESARLPDRVIPAAVKPGMSRPAAVPKRPAVAAAAPRRMIKPPPAARPPAAVAAPKVPPQAAAEVPPRGRITATHVECPGRLDFKGASLRFQPAGRAVMDCVVALLRANPRITMIRVGGHTDSTGPASYNKRLSAQRASAVRKYLLSKGVDKRRVYFKGYGQAVPVASNTTAEGRARNRRIEFLILEIDNVPVPRERPPGVK